MEKNNLKFYRYCICCSSVPLVFILFIGVGLLGNGALCTLSNSQNYTSIAPIIPINGTCAFLPSDETIGSTFLLFIMGIILSIILSVLFAILCFVIFGISYGISKLIGNCKSKIKESRNSTIDDNSVIYKLRRPYC